MAKYCLELELWRANIYGEEIEGEYQAGDYIIMSWLMPATSCDQHFSFYYPPNLVQLQN
jgi:hypothetical protein